LIISIYDKETEHPASQSAYYEGQDAPSLSKIIYISTDQLFNVIEQSRRITGMLYSFSS
jgi:hypothetical protein